MLLTPILSLTLYTGFLLYSHAEYKQSNEKIEEIREEYFPLMELAGENTRLFKDIVTRFKDAVLAGEVDWVTNTKTLKEQIDANFNQFSRHPEIVDSHQLQQLRNDFSLYYSNALILSLALLNNNEALSDQDEFIQNVEHYIKASRSQFEGLKEIIRGQYKNAIDLSTRRMDQLLFWGSVMAVLLLLAMTVVTFMLSLSTRRSFQQVIDRMKALANGQTDFSQRLERDNKDELGYLVHWFNKLSEKLEQDYIKIEQVSVTDKLTQLYNRVYTDECLQQTLRQAHETRQKIVGILLDIDHFKAINDQHGHMVGDSVLKDFSVILKANTRDHDCVGRWGGEEFIIIMPNINLAHATTKAELLREKIAEHGFAHGSQVTASFGVAISTRDDTPESMIKRADDSLYLAKRQGRNRVVVADN